MRRALEIGFVGLVAVSLQGGALGVGCDVMAQSCSEQSMACGQAPPEEAPARGHCGEPVSAISDACCGAARSEPVTGVSSVPNVGAPGATVTVATHLAAPHIASVSLAAAIAPPAPTRHPPVLRL